MKKTKKIMIVILYGSFTFLFLLSLGDFIFGVDVVNELQLSKTITSIISIVVTFYTSILFYKKLSLKYPRGKSLLEFSNSYVVFHLKTTGFNKEFHKIIEIGAIKIIEGKIVQEFNELIKPSNSVSKKVTNMTGITNSMLENKQDFSVVGKKFNDFVKDYIVVVHNANFNIDFIYKNFIDYNVGIFNNNFIDTQRLSRMLVKDSENHKLETLVNYFNFEQIGSYMAMADTINTHKLLFELEKIYVKDSNKRINKRDIK